MFLTIVSRWKDLQSCSCLQHLIGNILCYSVALSTSLESTLSEMPLVVPFCTPLQSNITYIRTVLGWVYLATVIDLYNRKIIGYSLSKKIDAKLSNSLARNADVSGLIFHSDSGCHFSSRSYRDMLEQYGIRSSMSRPGCPNDNSFAESFFATIKKECIYRTLTFSTQSNLSPL
ncbi:MAG: hypothetical protein CVU91_07265 [Firmicutes bacterium HGW-Firmicutes-16]|nr:MAG: hypothetical protein CVU91_07265 [Firmicutes bacterium HGW-Firmicutes-16]